MQSLPQHKVFTEIQNLLWWPVQRPGASYSFTDCTLTPQNRCPGHPKPPQVGDSSSSARRMGDRNTSRDLRHGLFNTPLCLCPLVRRLTSRFPHRDGREQQQGREMKEYSCSHNLTPGWNLRVKSVIVKRTCPGFRLYFSLWLQTEYQPAVGITNAALWGYSSWYAALFATDASGTGIKMPTKEIFACRTIWRLAEKPLNNKQLMTG